MGVGGGRGVNARPERHCCVGRLRRVGSFLMCLSTTSPPLPPPLLPTGMQYGYVANSGASSASAATSGPAAAPSSSSSDDDEEEEEDEEAGLLWLFPCPPSRLCYPLHPRTLNTV